MKTIGLIGGMSWESSLEYYRVVNEEVKTRLGGLHSARCILCSVDFAEVEAPMRRGDWETVAANLVRAARSLEMAGADFLVVCTNTMHKLADEIQAGVNIPLLHIADAAAKPILGMNLRTVGLLGTRPTMEEDFYARRLRSKFGLTVLIPDEPEREAVHRIIFDELCLGVIRDESRELFRGVMRRLAGRGAEGMILGCTEIESLVRPEDSPVPVFPTARLHALAAVEAALAEGPVSLETPGTIPGM
jgi:aspartate racemase